MKRAGALNLRAVGSDGEIDLHRDEAGLGQSPRTDNRGAHAAA